MTDIFEIFIFLIGWLVSTIIIFLTTRIFGKKGLKRALITSISGSLVYSLFYYLIGNNIISGFFGMIVWLFLLKSLYKISWIKSILIAFFVWIITSVLGILLPTLPGPL